MTPHSLFELNARGMEERDGRKWTGTYNNAHACVRVFLLTQRRERERGTRQPWGPPYRNERFIVFLFPPVREGEKKRAFGGNREGSVVNSKKKLSLFFVGKSDKLRTRSLTR